MHKGIERSDRFSQHVLPIFQRPVNSQANFKKCNVKQEFDKKNQAPRLIFIALSRLNQVTTQPHHTISN